MARLFEPVRVGALSLGHRAVMAPLTRMRSSPGNLPNALMREYYTQRASEGGLILSEATPVSLRGYGFAGAPGIYDDGQIEGWRAITDAVHARGGTIAMQLWHVGRKSHTELQPGGAAPVAPSAITAEGKAHTVRGLLPYSPPRALERDEIPGVVAEYRAGAERARRAGFDAVEIHGANGYLPDQFLQDSANHRTDDYGGSVANRARFLLEVTAAAAEAFGADRVGVRLSPGGTSGSMFDSDPQATFGYVAERLDAMGIAWLHVFEQRRFTEPGVEPAGVRQMRAAFRGTVIAAGGFNGGSAEALLRDGDADMVAFGRSFIANPDLPERLRRNLPLNPYDATTFYGGDARGYTDYPFHHEMTSARPASRAA